MESNAHTPSVLVQECRRAYERLPSEAQYRLKQRCAEDKAARTRPEAFQRALYSITGQGGPQQAHTEGTHIPSRACVTELWPQLRTPSSGHMTWLLLCAV